MLVHWIALIPLIVERAFLVEPSFSTSLNGAKNDRFQYPIGLGDTLKSLICLKMFLFLNDTIQFMMSSNSIILDGKSIA